MGRGRSQHWERLKRIGSLLGGFRHPFNSWPAEHFLVQAPLSQRMFSDRTREACGRQSRLLHSGCEAGLSTYSSNALEALWYRLDALAQKSEITRTIPEVLVDVSRFVLRLSTDQEGGGLRMHLETEDMLLPGLLRGEGMVAASSAQQQALASHRPLQLPLP